MTVKTAAKQIEKTLTKATQRKKAILDGDWLSLGSTVLNLAVSGRADGGIAKGMYLYFVGDSSSGKSYFSLTILAEAAKNPNFKNHKFVYDDVERGNLFDTVKYFGEDVARRLRPPRGTKESPIHSETIQEFYHNFDRNVEAGPCIYILDSMDALLAKEDEEKFAEEGEALDKGKEIKGSYGMAKAKANSNNIKRAVSKLTRNGSILIVISQTRDKIGGYGGKTRAGGRALKFYSHVELWTSIRKDLKKTVLGKEREYGKLVHIDIEKNRINGRSCTVAIPFLWDFGIDNTGACVEYLCEEKHWPTSKKGGIVTAPEFAAKARKEKLIEWLELKDERIKKLDMLTQFVWRKIADATAVKRKKRY